MSAAGFDYRPVAYIDDTVSDVIVNPLNEPVAKVYGYHLPSLTEDPNDEAVIEAAGFEAALLGSDRLEGQGCADRGYRFAYAFDESEELWSELDGMLAVIEGGALTFETTQRSRDLTDEWSRCMEARGYEYAAPLEANTEFSDDQTVGERELEVRWADLECDRDSGLTSARSAFEVDRIALAVDEQAEAITAIEHEITTVLRLLTDRNDLLVTMGAAALPE